MHRLAYGELARVGVSDGRLGAPIVRFSLGRGKKLSGSDVPVRHRRSPRDAQLRRLIARPDRLDADQIAIVELVVTVIAGGVR